MEIKVRGFTKSELHEFKQFAKKNSLSMSQLASNIIKEFIQDETSFQHHKKFFDEQAEPLAKILKRNSDLMEKIYEELKIKNGNQN